MRKERRIVCLILAVTALCAWALPAGAEGTSESLFVLESDGYPTAAGTLMAQMSVDGIEIQVLRDNTAIEESVFVATGDTLVVLDEDETVSFQQIIVVPGDVLGTGEISVAQIVRLGQALTGADPLTGAYALAADADCSGRLTIADLALVAEQLQQLSSSFQHVISAKTVDLYPYWELEAFPLDLYFVDGQEDIPYLDIETVCDMILLGNFGDLVVEDAGDGVVLVQRAYNDSTVIFDCNRDVITFGDMNLFFETVGASTCLDLVIAGLEAEDGVEYISRPAGSFERLGHSVYLDLGAYGIDAIYQNGTAYLPMQTVSDVFLSMGLKLTALYNGESVFLLDGSPMSDEIKELYYTSEPQERTPALAEFSYNELCLALDLLYGLQQQHNIEGFDAFFEETGLRERLLSTDPVEADKAAYEMCEGYLGDVHTTFRDASWYAGQDADVTSDNISISRRDVLANGEKFAAAREAYFPDGCPAYQEVGNTAFVTFDDFVWPQDADYYGTAPEADAEDTLGIIMYAHAQITRADSPIENVVLDLSANGGGDLDAGVIALAWFLGGETMIDLNCTATGAQASTLYSIDINADGVCDERDTVADRNLFCLTSGASFSCGNLVPSYFKQSDSVTLLGQRTAGGACAVLAMSMADGTYFRISGPMCLSTKTNGSYYDVDRGVEPDYPITEIDHFYDRETLTQYLNTQIFR